MRSLNFLHHFAFVMSVLFFASCQDQTEGVQRGFFYLEGPDNKEVILYRSSFDEASRKKLVPLKKLKTNTKILLPSGSYLLANECSSYEFFHSAQKEFHITLNQLQLGFFGKKSGEPLDKDQVVHSLCYNVVANRDQHYTDKTEFELLPGKNWISIAGKTFSFQLEANKAEKLSLDLNPISLQSTLPSEGVNFFLRLWDEKKEEPKKVVTSVPINGTVWVYPGQYQVEVNGTTQTVTLGANNSVKLNLGVVRIETPKNFPMDERLKLGGQPISAFINEKVLLRLNTDYHVIPGQYNVNLDGSEIVKKAVVKENEITRIHTFGAQILPPVCSVKETCKTSPRITIHMDKQPFTLMAIPAGLPFLVFDESYQYSVEGVRGIFKSLPVSNDSVRQERLGKIKIKWEEKLTTSLARTNFVRVEAKSVSLFGKSVDLNFFKPSELFLPDGEYSLTYFIGDQSLAANKNKIPIWIANGETKEAVVPLYVQKNEFEDKKELDKQRSNAASDSMVLSPILK